jgi:hypothetical protein
MEQIEGGDGTHFNADKEVLRVAAGTYSNPIILPMPIAYAIQTVLNLQRPSIAVGPDELKTLYSVIMRAKSRDELYRGVRPHGAVRQRVGFYPHVVREQLQEGEGAHIKRLRWAKQSGISLPSRGEWTFNLAKQMGLVLQPEQASWLGESLDASYRFDSHIWKLAMGPNYNFEKHRNDWTDLQQTMYLCDPAIHVMTADKGIVQKVKGSHQADRIIYLPDYVKQNALVLGSPTWHPRFKRPCCFFPKP